MNYYTNVIIPITQVCPYKTMLEFPTFAKWAFAKSTEFRNMSTTQDQLTGPSTLNTELPCSHELVLVDVLDFNYFTSYLMFTD